MLESLSRATKDDRPAPHHEAVHRAEGVAGPGNGRGGVHLQLQAAAIGEDPARTGAGAEEVHVVTVDGRLPQVREGAAARTRAGGVRDAAEHHPLAGGAGSQEEEQGEQEQGASEHDLSP